MKKFNFSHLVAIALTAMTLCLVGCEQPKDPTLSALEGKWKSAYDEVYTITADTFDAGEYSYAGNELEIVEDDETSGRIFVKYTRAYCLTHSDYAKFIFAYDTDAPDVGKWYAIHYEDLTESSVKISGAYGAKSSTNTLEEAKSEFTVDNGYFEKHSECTKVTE